MKKIASILLCLVMLFSASVVFGRMLPEESIYYPGDVQQLLTDYRNSKYGDELYQFSVWNTNGGGTLTATINVTDGIADITVDEAYGNQLRTRKLTAVEYQSVVSFMDKYQVDSLPDWNTGHVFDGVVYYLTHIGPDGVSYVYMNNPGSYIYRTNDPEFDDWYKDYYVATYGDDSAYVGLVELFNTLINSGDFQVSVKESPADNAPPIKVRVNGEEIDFYEKPLVDNGRVQVWGNIFKPIGAEASSIYGTNATFVCRGNKVLVLPAGADYMIELDLSGFDSADALMTDLSDGGMFQKSYCRLIHLDTIIKSGYYPIRAMCEAFGAEVTWNDEEKTIDVAIDNSGLDNLPFPIGSRFMSLIMQQKINEV